MSEQRIKEAYARRNDVPVSEMGEGDRFIHRRRDEELASLLLETGVSFAGLRILEVGCGDGRVLETLVALGAEPGSMAGIDLLPGRIGVARSSLPAADIQEGNAERLPWDDGSFDIIVQFTFLSSVIEAGARQRGLLEMRRVLKPSGIILWYDFIWNPLNRQTRGLSLRQMRDIFPGAATNHRRVTLLPQLARLVAPFSDRLCRLLERLPFLRTHNLAVIRPGAK